MNNTIQLFFELVRCGSMGRMPEVALFRGEVAWEALFEVAKRQALVGVTFEAVRQLPKEVAPPLNVLLQWLGMARQIAAKNLLLNERAVEAERWFAERGFKSCVLKGQGLARLYANTESRQPGDIDLWVMPKTIENGEWTVNTGKGRSLSAHRKEVMKVVQEVGTKGLATYHHVDMPLFDDVEMEVHFTPSWMFSPWRNRRLQRFFQAEAGRMSEQTEAGFHVPLQGFNLVYLLVHIYRHLFDEGVGLRQVVDYGMLLHQGLKTKTITKTITGTKTITETESDEEVMKVLKELGMERFTRGMMWVLERVLGLERECLLCNPDGQEGRFLLSEIMRAGNFGQYDERNRHAKDENTWQRFIRKTTRSWHFVSHYPSEVLWSPLWKVWHWIWRRV